MARVYRFDEIQHLTAPTPETFASELDTIRSDFHDLHEKGLVDGVFIWGSAAHGDASPRSDFDLIIATPTTELESLAAIQGVTNRVYRRSGIPTDASTYPSTSLRDGSHGYFRKNAVVWLNRLSAKTPENIIGQNPVDMITPVQTSLTVDMDKTLVSDHGVLLRHYLRGEAHPNKETALEHVFDLPHHVGRRVVSTLVVQGYLPESTLPSPRRSHVANALHQTLGAVDPKVTEIAAEIYADETAYTGLLDAAMIGEVTKEEYDQVVAHALQHNLPRAMEFVDAVHDVYRQYTGLEK